MADIVSLWNRCKGNKSHIIFGVDVKTSNDEWCGIEKSSDDHYFQNMFLSDLFTCRPNFRYEEKTVDRVLFGIITVFSSRDTGPPCILRTQTDDTDCRPLRPNILYYRHNGRNEVCKPENKVYSEIFNWMMPKDRKEVRGYFAPTAKENLKKINEHVGYFQKGSFILIANHCENTIEKIEAISLVPWILVFDFDIESADTGLYSVCEKILKEKRALYTSTWATIPADISEQATTWCFLMGENHRPSTLVDTDPKKWYSRIKNGLNDYCRRVSKFTSDYSVVNIVILWNKGEMLLPHLRKLLTKLDDALDSLPKMVLCISPMTNADQESIDLQAITEDHDILVINPFYPESLCLGILSLLDKDTKSYVLKHNLPTHDGIIESNITLSDAAWLSEHFDILYINCPTDLASCDLDKEADSFLRGAVLSWQARYFDHIDVERDILPDILDTIRSTYIKHCKSGILSLYHAPGAGGTTFVQRVLWELHRETPCMQLKTYTESSVPELINKLTYVYEKTVMEYKPIILMVNGADENIVRQLMKEARRLKILIVHVRRFLRSMNSCRNSEKTFYLKGAVSSKEAKSLSLKYKGRCEQNDQIESLQKLVNCVENGERHCMYEFGLATYSHEYKGVKKYVKGYLDIEHNPQPGQLLIWQVMLGYLSLVYYYGQASMPYQFFAHLFGKPANYAMALSDIPTAARELIVQDENDAKKFRICHYLVAKEILDQVLNIEQIEHAYDGKTPTLLSYQARINLCKFAKAFIEYAKKRQTSHMSPTSDMIQHILTRTFIFRDNNEVGSGEISPTQKKTTLSAILTEIPSNKPYTERLEILEKLIEAYPANPSFYAHLGRFYGIYRPDKEEEAENALQTALSLCNKAEKHEGTHRIGHTLKNIYHMFGMLFLRRIAAYTGILHREKPSIATNNDAEFIENVKNIMDLAKKACLHFENCRIHTLVGDETCYGYVGEINARLHVCDYVSKHCSGRFDAFLQSSEDDEITSFINESFSEIDGLINQCYDAVDPEEIDRSFQNATFWYVSLFKGPHDAIRRSDFVDDTNSRRLKIAALKMHYRKPTTKKTNSNVIDLVTSPDDLHLIVRYLEKNIEEAHEHGDTNINYDMDYKQWLIAIRHDRFRESYTLEHVYGKVREWYEDRKSPSSTFYYFVINSLIAFQTAQNHVQNDYLLEALRLKSELSNVKFTATKLRMPREWIGSDNTCGIKQLIHWRMYNQQNKQSTGEKGNRSFQGHNIWEKSKSQLGTY